MSQQADSSEQWEQSLIDIAVESWRFSRLFGKVASKLDAGESGRYMNQLRYFQKKVEEGIEANGLKLVNVEGHPYDPGMATSALNLGDFGPDDVAGVAILEYLAAVPRLTLSAPVNRMQSRKLSNLESNQMSLKLVGIILEAIFERTVSSAR